jgi:orotate phosphoribosyltransferase
VTATFDLPRALEERGALLTGHFKLSSGRHSAQFIQKFRILEYPQLVERVAAAIIAQLPRAPKPNVVVSAAVGGIVLGYEVARQLGARAIFVEKDAGVPTLRRGFLLGPDDRAVIVEDVVTTGGSVKEVIDIVQRSGAQIVGLGVIVRREPIEFGVPTIALVELPIASFAPEECPSCKAGEPITEPGSRFLR